jgi:hypothetical protein
MAEPGKAPKSVPDGGPSVGSEQDGEDPGRRSDMLEERSRPGRHGGGGSPGWRPGAGSADADNKETPPGA